MANAPDLTSLHHFFDDMGKFPFSIFDKIASALLPQITRAIEAACDEASIRILVPIVSLQSLMSCSKKLPFALAEILE